MKSLLIVFGLFCVIYAQPMYHGEFNWEGKFRVTESCATKVGCCCAKNNSIIDFTSEGELTYAQISEFEDVESCEVMGWAIDNEAVFPWESPDIGGGQFKGDDGVIYTVNLSGGDIASILMDQSSIGLAKSCPMIVERV